jgi:hypothetical protein
MTDNIFVMGESLQKTWQGDSAVHFTRRVDVRVRPAVETIVNFHVTVSLTDTIARDVSWLCRGKD